MSEIFAGLKLVTGPSVEPIEVADVKIQARIDVGYVAEDSYIERLISMARQWSENYLRRAFLPQTWRLSLRNWPGRSPQMLAGNALDSYYKLNHIKLPRPPLSSVTSVIYYDTANTSYTMPQGNVGGGYNVDIESEPGRIVLPFSGIWPTEILLPGSPIHITYNGGYADVATFTNSFEGSFVTVQAILLLAAHWYDVRQPVVELTKAKIGGKQLQAVMDLLDPHRISEGVN